MCLSSASESCKQLQSFSALIKAIVGLPPLKVELRAARSLRIAAIIAEFPLLLFRDEWCELFSWADVSQRFP